MAKNLWWVILDGAVHGASLQAHSS